MNLEVPIMAGVGGTNFADSLSWVKYLETTPVDSYLMVTPLYTKPGEKGQTQWFQKLLDAASKPCVLYNIPSRTGKPLDHNTVKQLSSHPNFYGIKEASGSVDEFLKYVCDAPNAVVFSGDDGLLPQFALAGAKGLISVIANVWPKETNCYTKLCIALKLDGVLPAWKKISESLFIVSNPIPAKVMLHYKGIIKTPKLRLPLTHEEMNSMDELLTADKMVSEWTYSCKGWEK
jgi:4-hydroxy-tetrahydrodipicolinate synthase